MKFEIKHRWSGEILFSIESESIKLAVEAAVISGADLGDAYLGGADLGDADLGGAYLGGADLRGAYLGGADLGDADLGGADLRGAYLGGAYLGGADLGDANLGGAKGINKFITTPLYILLDQIGKIRAFKLVNSKNEGPYNGGIKYKIGEVAEVKKADCNENIECSYGISLATLDWCIKEWQKGHKILVAEFSRKDIAAIPVGSDGKFRVKRCKIVGEKNLKELGLMVGKDAACVECANCGELMGMLEIECPQCPKEISDA